MHASLAKPAHPPWCKTASRTPGVIQDRPLRRFQQDLLDGNFRTLRSNLSHGLDLGEDGNRNLSPASDLAGKLCMISISHVRSFGKHLLGVMPSFLTGLVRNPASRCSWPQRTGTSGISVDRFRCGRWNYPCKSPEHEFTGLSPIDFP